MPSPSRGLGKAVLIAIGVRLALVPLFMAANRVMLGNQRRFASGDASFERFKTVMAVENGARLVTTMLVALLFMIWVRSEIVALRNAGIHTKTTPGMAIAGWFIPFANFVFPLLGVMEVVKLRQPRAAALPIVWWIAYLASMVSNNVPLPFPLGLLITLTAFGTWFAIVWTVVMTPAQAQQGPIPYPHLQQPLQPYYAPPPRM